MFHLVYTSVFSDSKTYDMTQLGVDDWTLESTDEQAWRWSLFTCSPNDDATPVYVMSIDIELRSNLSKYKMHSTMSDHSSYGTSFHDNITDDFYLASKSQAIPTSVHKVVEYS